MQKTPPLARNLSNLKYSFSVESISPMVITFSHG
uniref:Uncharacterized protein n=1 Tax=Arundo donax TaxID=35708 RepID=A0A0A8Y0K5_ARUDO